LADDREARGTAGRRMSELRTLQDFIWRDCAASEENAVLRKQLLDVIDRLLLGGYRGVDAIAKAPGVCGPENDASVVIDLGHRRHYRRYGDHDRDHHDRDVRGDIKASTAFLPANNRTRIHPLPN
jgi:hypothetical protein